MKLPKRSIIDYVLRDVTSSVLTLDVLTALKMLGVKTTMERDVDASTSAFSSLTV